MRLPKVILVLAVGVGALLDAHQAFAEEKTLAPTEVTVDVETCKVPLVQNGVTYLLAEHRYPKRDAASLSRVTVLGRQVVPPTGASVPPGYAYQRITDGVFVRDGAVAVVCGTSSEKPYETLVFVMPRQYKLDLDTANPW